MACGPSDKCGTAAWSDSNEECGDEGTAAWAASNNECGSEGAAAWSVLCPTKDREVLPNLYPDVPWEDPVFDPLFDENDDIAYPEDGTYHWRLCVASTTDNNGGFRPLCMESDPVTGVWLTTGNCDAAANHKWLSVSIYRLIAQLWRLSGGVIYNDYDTVSTFCDVKQYASFGDVVPDHHTGIPATGNQTIVKDIQENSQVTPPADEFSYHVFADVKTTSGCFTPTQEECGVRWYLASDPNNTWAYWNPLSTYVHDLDDNQVKGISYGTCGWDAAVFNPGDVP